VGYSGGAGEKGRVGYSGGVGERRDPSSGDELSRESDVGCAGVSDEEGVEADGERWMRCKYVHTYTISNVEF